MNIETAKKIAKATEWTGDIRVNFHTAIKAASVLHKEVERLEKELEDIKERHVSIGRNNW